MAQLPALSLLLLLLLQPGVLLRGVLGVDPSCGPGPYPVPVGEWTPTPEAVEPVGKWFGGMDFNATVCAWTFLQHEQSFANWRMCYLMPRPNQHTCTRHCLRAAQLPQVAVYGSFPYHADSSICLAAIHAGLIRDEDGGGVFMARFWPADWSNSSTQTVFPAGSDAPTNSNGVSSLQVPAAWMAVPAPLSSYSWTLKSRGVVANQRQTAPWSPRAGHASINLARIWNRVPWDGVTRSVAPGRYWDHLLIGGMNGSHYMVGRSTYTCALRAPLCADMR